jgi:hypothetical protein
MAIPKSTPSQSQTQTWSARSYQGEAPDTDLEDDDDLDIANSEGLPNATKDEFTLELDSSSDDDLNDLDIAQRANEEIIGDVDGEDYRAGTIDPDGSDRGLRLASSELIEDDEDGRRSPAGPGGAAGLLRDDQDEAE